MRALLALLLLAVPCSAQTVLSPSTNRAPTTFTPSGAWSTNTTYSGAYWAEGDVFHALVKIALSGAPTGTLTLNVPAPNSETLDESDLLATAANQTAIGYGFVQDASGSDRSLVVAIYDHSANNIGMFCADGSDGDLVAITATAPVVFTTSDVIYLTLTFPITAPPAGGTRVTELTAVSSRTITGTRDNCTYHSFARRVGRVLHDWAGCSFSGTATAVNTAFGYPDSLTPDETLVETDTYLGLDIFMDEGLAANAQSYHLGTYDAANDRLSIQRTGAGNIVDPSTTAGDAADYYTCLRAAPIAAGWSLGAGWTTRTHQTAVASWTPTGSWTDDADVDYSGRWRRVGDCEEGAVLVALNAAPDAVALTITPQNTVDESKLPVNLTVVGQGIYRDDSAVNKNRCHIVALYDKANNNVQIQVRDSGLTYAPVTNLVNVTFAANDYVYFTYRLPVSGW